MKYSRRFLLWFAGASSCCLTTLVCTPSFGQVPATQPSSTPSSNANTTGAQQGGAAAGASNNSAGTNAQSSAGNPGAASQGGAMSAGAMGCDAGLAAWLIVDNEGEVAVSEIGRQKAQDPAVKEFADRMIQEHNQMLTKLRPIAGNMNATNMIAGGRRTDSVQAGAQQAGGQQPNTQQGTQQQTGRQQAGQQQAGGAANTGATSKNPGANTAAAGSGATAGAGAASQQNAAGPLSAITLKRELGAQCLQSKQKELNEKQGAEFDKCFMGMQVAMHMEAADTLKVFQKHASGQLRQTLDEALQTTQAHLEHAKQVQKTVEEKAKNDRAGGSANK